jgi:O-antigen/teichoic acid export membrane protein
MVLRATRFNTLLNAVLAALIIAYGESILRVWVGNSYAQLAYPVLIVLTITQVIRLAASGYSIALMATGHQNSAIWPAVVEAVVNLAASLWAVTRFGPLGVAYGSLVGAMLAIPSLLILSVKVRKDLTITRSDLGARGMMLGLAPALPALLCSVYIVKDHIHALRSIEIWAASTILGIVIFYQGERLAAEKLVEGSRDIVV